MLKYGGYNLIVLQNCTEKYFKENKFQKKLNWHLLVQYERKEMNKFYIIFDSLHKHYIVLEERPVTTEIRK